MVSSSTIINCNGTITECNRAAEVNILRVSLAHLTEFVVLNFTKYGAERR
jgi:hypothetical protein